jgi:ubiquinone/menaquinone biosynthesis C-methylase UbiE
MSNYNIFSHFYDIFTYDVDYKKRTDYLLSLFNRFDKTPTLILDFACGTGNFSVEFAKRDIEVIGVDISEDMLCEAQAKNLKLKRPVMYLCQRGCELDLYGTVDGAVSCLDSLNHITDFEELKNTFKKLSLFLEKDRLFIFDMNTVYKHREVLAESSYRVKRKGVECLWSNRILDDSVTVEITLSFTYKTGLFKKETVTETFCERAYTEEEITELLKSSGFELLATFGENTFLPPKADSQRNIYVARKVM